MHPTRHKFPVRMKTIRETLLILGAVAMAVAVHAETKAEIVFTSKQEIVLELEQEEPALSYSTLFGGSSLDAARAVAVDKNTGDIYVAGNTRSRGLATPGAYQTNFAGGNLFGDGFVAKFDSTRSNLLYFTYLGGSADEAVLGLAIGMDGSAYVCGATTSTNFPTKFPLASTNYALSDSRHHRYLYDAFVAKIEPGGSNLVYSTYLGGFSNDQAVAVATDSSGNAYVTGFTHLTDDRDQVFVQKISFDGSATIPDYLAFIGGSGTDHAEGIAVDSDGSAFITGFTTSTNFPTTSNAIQTLLNGSTNLTGSADVFILKLDPAASTNLVFSTLLGGSGNDYGFGIALDSDGDPYVTGMESSTTNFPADASFGASSNTTSRAFLTRLSSTNGTDYMKSYSVTFGGRGVNQGIGVAVDSLKNAYVVGTTTATKDFPTNNIPDPARGKNAGARDVFVTKFDSSGTNLLYSFYLGGSRNDVVHGIDVKDSTAYVVGQTFSSKFPQTNATPRKLMGRSDAFITIISPLPPPPPPPPLFP